MDNQLCKLIYSDYTAGTDRKQSFFVDMDVMKMGDILYKLL